MKNPSTGTEECTRMNNYVIKELIESGTTSQVYHGIDSRSKKQVAIKVINRKRYVGVERKSTREERILREVLVSFLLDHRNIVKLRDFFFTDEFFYLVFDYIKGEQLLKKIVKKKKFSEKVARKYFLDVLSAVSYCHEYQIIHRDIKIENILIDKDNSAKLIDFGLSNFYDREGFLGTFCGSLYFAAPELLSGMQYEGPEIDIWSMGVVLYVMVCGKVPFDDRNIQSLYQKIIAGNLAVEGLSSELESLLRRMLDPNRTTRITMQEIQKDRWIMQEKVERRRKTVVDPALATYINYLFGNQFAKTNGEYSAPLELLSDLFKNRKRGKILTTRMESIVDFVSDRKLSVKKRVIRHWGGMKAKEDRIVKCLEDVLRGEGLFFEIVSGKYMCTNSHEKICFALQIARNRFSKAYGVELADTTREYRRAKEIKNEIVRKLREMVAVNRLPVRSSEERAS